MKCRSCDKEEYFISILNLGEHAWCNNFIEKEYLNQEKKYPLHLVYCKNCEMLQLNYTVPKEVMFTKHDYLSGTTKTLKEHFKKLAKENIEQFNLSKEDKILDIGGNDGTQLLQYKELGITNSTNVESAKNIANISIKNNILTYNTFFNEYFAYKYYYPGFFKLINASGIFFHLEELHSVIRAIKYLLHPEGVFIVQFMYAGMMIEKQTFDMIYHEHLCYYTIKSLENLLRSYGLKIFDAYFSDIHSGSIITKICHISDNKSITNRCKVTINNDKKYTLNDFITFGKNIENNKQLFKSFISHLKNSGAKIYAYGAPAKGNTFLTYLELDNTIIDKIVEVNELKIGKYTPVTHIPIVKESDCDIPDYYLLLSHNFEKEIMEKNQQLRDKGLKFIIPFSDNVYKWRIV